MNQYQPSLVANCRIFSKHSSWIPNIHKHHYTQTHSKHLWSPMHICIGAGGYETYTHTRCSKHILCILLYILDSKGNAYFKYPFPTRNPYRFFSLNDMNMFDWTHAFVKDHFIRHYAVKIIFCLLMQNNKTAPFIGKHRIWIRYHSCHQNTL